ncbi:MAG: ABC transporter ATP-binding protein, partial [Cyclobacteriaceae bacterium]
MKIFLRILSYANRLPRRLAFFFLYSILGIIFGAFNIVLVMPMLDILFKQTAKIISIPELPSFSLSVDYITGVFNHYFVKIVVTQGAVNSLLFVCGLIVACVILANLFRYLERVMATKIRVDLVKNIR